MVENKINTLLIGLGKIGCGYDFSENFRIDDPNSSKKIISHARALTVHPNFNLISGIDNDSNASEKFKSLYKKPIYGCIDDFIENNNIEIDLVIIAVIPHNQPKLVKEIIKKLSPKILLLEKPLATSLSEAKEIKKMCDSKPNLIVCVNYVRRYLPLVRRWQKIISSKELGNFLNGNLTYGKGLLTNGSHFINLAQYWLGKLNNYKTLKNKSFYQDFDRETSFILRSEENGALLNIHSIGSHKLRAGELDLWFEKGRLCWLNNGNGIYFWPRKNSVNPLETYDSLSEHPEVHFTEITKCQYYVLESINQYLFGNKKVSLPCLIDDSIETMELMHKAFSSEIQNDTK